MKATSTRLDIQELRLGGSMPNTMLIRIARPVATRNHNTKLNFNQRNTLWVSPSTIRCKLAALLPFKDVGDLVDLSREECDFELRRQDDPLRWLLNQAQRSVSLDPVPDRSLDVTPPRVIVFTAWPGEESNFGLCQYPANIRDPRRQTHNQTARLAVVQLVQNPVCL